MFTPLHRAVRRLVHPRSRRSELWACVYTGAFETEPRESADAPGTRRAD